MLEGHLHILETYSLTYCMGNKLNRGAYIKNLVYSLTLTYCTANKFTRGNCIRNLKFNIEWFDDLAKI